MAAWKRCCPISTQISPGCHSPRDRGARVYAGHADTLQLVKDQRAAMGSFRIEWEEFTELDDGRLVCPGQTVTITDIGETLGLSFVCFLTFRDGLVYDLESEPRAGT